MRNFMELLNPLPRVILVTGHYGSGKTNLAVNLAFDLRQLGRNVALCDLDLVNPYFRSADFADKLRAKGIEAIIPLYANSNLDIPAVGAGLSSALGRKELTVIVDVGGDDAGAIALGRYAQQIAEKDYAMLYVYNRYRYLTRDPAAAMDILTEISAVSRLSPTGIVNNSNLGEETDCQTVEGSAAACRALEEFSGLPLLWHCAPRRLAGDLGLSPVYPVEVYVRKPWEAAEA